MKKFVSLLPVLFLLLLAPSASAADLFTTASGGSTSSATCPASDPCTLPRAVEVAVSGDNILLQSATYSLSESLEISDPTLTISGPLVRSSSFPVLNFTAPDKSLYIFTSGVRLERMKIQGNTGFDPLVTSVAGVTGLNLSRVQVVNTGGYPTVSATDANIINSIIVAAGDGVGARLTGTLKNSTVRASSNGMPAIWNTDAYLAPGNESHLDIINSVIISSATGGKDIDADDSTPGGAVPTVAVRNSLASSSKKFQSGSASIAFTVGNLEDQEPALDGLFQQTFSSPGIDNGCSVLEAICTPLPNEKDFFGNPRLSGAGLDIGAHEADQDAPVIASVKLPGKVRAGRALKGTLLLQESASAPVALTATLQGRGKKSETELNVNAAALESRITISVKTKKGSRAFSAGRYSYRLCAADAVGNASACTTRTVRLTK